MCLCEEQNGNYANIAWYLTVSVPGKQWYLLTDRHILHSAKWLTREYICPPEFLKSSGWLNIVILKGGIKCSNEDICIQDSFEQPSLWYNNTWVFVNHFSMSNVWWQQDTGTVGFFHTCQASERLHNSRYIFIQPQRAREGHNNLHYRICSQTVAWIQVQLLFLVFCWCNGGFTTFRDVLAHLSDESEGFLVDSPQLPINSPCVDVSLRDAMKRSNLTVFLNYKHTKIQDQLTALVCRKGLRAFELARKQPSTSL